MKMQNGFLYHVFGLILVCALASTAAFGGPIILGGDDLDLHGSYSGGANQKGWLYIQKALDSMYRANCITRPNDLSIAALGCPSSTAPSGDAGGAIHFAGNVALNKTVNCYKGAAAITGFFAALSANTAKPAIIYIPSSWFDAAHGVDATEGPVLTANAAALQSFVNSGGGLMAHIDGPLTSGWVTTVLPGVVVNLSACNSMGATLTPAGILAFPLLTANNINNTAGPCHASFSGSLGSLSVLAQDGATPKRNFIIGGDCGTTISTATPTPTPTPTAAPSPTPTPTPTPPQTPTGCAQVTGEARCLPDGGYGYTFTVTNNTGSDMSQILLTPLAGSTFTLSPQLFNLSSPLHNGQSATLTVSIGNAKPGDKVCFFVSLMSEKTQCCIVQVCLTLPTCGELPNPTRQAPQGRKRP